MSRPSRTHRLAAVWFADLVGYSSLASQNEPAALRLLDLFQEVAGELVAWYGGRVVKLIGDAALAEFTSADAAVRCAVALQREFASRSADLGLPGQLRIGVHLGEVVSAADGDLYGDGVNITARLQGDAEPGQVLVSEDVWRQLRQRPVYHFTPLGERNLKGIAAPVAVFDVQLVEAEEMPRSLHSAAGKTAAPAERPATRSIAVLPFVNMSADPENEYFSDGLSEELLNVLAQIPALRVVARTSSFAFKGKDVPIDEIATRLNATHVLEGSVRKAGQRVRITAQLIAATEGYHLWSETYDRHLSDIFTLQDEIARAIAAALRVRLGVDEPLTRARETSSTEAHTLYLKGRFYAHKGSREGLEKALGYYHQALEHDPQYALAYAGISEAYGFLGDSYLPPQETLPKAVAAARRAIELDDRLADAHAILAMVEVDWGKNWPVARHALERTLELNPSHAMAHLGFGLYWLAMLHVSKGVAEARQAHRLDPLSPMISFFLEIFYLHSEDPDAALAQHEITQELAPGFVYMEAFHGDAYRDKEMYAEAITAYRQGEAALGRPASGLATTYVRMGRREEAEQIAEELERRTAAGEYMPPELIARIHVALGNYDRAFEWLEKGVEARSAVSNAVGVWTDFAPIRSDPRYRRLRERMGLAS